MIIQLHHEHHRNADTATATTSHEKDGSSKLQERSNSTPMISKIQILTSQEESSFGCTPSKKLEIYGASSHSKTTTTAEGQEHLKSDVSSLNFTLLGQTTLGACNNNNMKDDNSTKNQTKRTKQFSISLKDISYISYLKICIHDATNTSTLTINPVHISSLLILEKVGSPKTSGNQLLAADCEMDHNNGGLNERLEALDALKREKAMDEVSLTRNKQYA